MEVTHGGRGTLCSVPYAGAGPELAAGLPDTPLELLGENSDRALPCCRITFKTLAARSSGPALRPRACSCTGAAGVSPRPGLRRAGGWRLLLGSSSPDGGGPPRGLIVETKRPNL